METIELEIIDSDAKIVDIASSNEESENKRKYFVEAIILKTIYKKDILLVSWQTKHEYFSTE
jgi:hypothetical protein